MWRNSWGVWGAVDWHWHFQAILVNWNTLSRTSVFVVQVILKGIRTKPDAFESTSSSTSSVGASLRTHSSRQSTTMTWTNILWLGAQGIRPNKRAINITSAHSNPTRSVLSVSGSLFARVRVQSRIAELVHGSCYRTPCRPCFLFVFVNKFDVDPVSREIYTEYQCVFAPNKYEQVE